MTENSIRPACEEDFNFLVTSFMRSYLSGLEMSGHHANFNYDLNHKNYRNIVLRLLSCRDIHVLQGEYKNDIVGFIVHRTTPTATLVDWLYVKKSFREKGCGRKLLEFAGAGTKEWLLWTHYSRDVGFMVKKYKCKKSFICLELTWGF